MKVIRTILLVGFFAFILYVKFVTAPSGGQSMAPLAPGLPGPPLVQAQSVPQKAYQVLQIVRTTGQPPDGYVGGRVFENREGRLEAGGDYREFDVDPHNGQRNAERLIVEWKSKKAWYTGDHYQTFTPLP